MSHIGGNSRDTCNDTLNCRLCYPDPKTPLPRRKPRVYAGVTPNDLKRSVIGYPTRNTMEKIPLQLTMLFKLYVSTTHVREGHRYFGMDVTEDNERLAMMRVAMRSYIQALRTGVSCEFQPIRR